MRKKLLYALRDNAGHAVVRAVMQDAEAVVTEAYGMFVHTDEGEDRGDDDEGVNGLVGKGRTAAGTENGGPAGGSRTVAV